MVLTVKGVLYCWDTSIYNPDEIDIPAQLIAHEEVHSNQQSGHPEDWWDKYLKDSTFRFHQELEAHRVEYQRFYTNSNIRNERRLYLKLCAQRLSGPLYGQCVTFKQAFNLIKENS